MSVSRDVLILKIIAVPLKPKSFPLRNIIIPKDPTFGIRMADASPISAI